ncbi:MAG: ATPase domain-containing protein [Acetobacteraceae bacterium]
MSDTGGSVLDRVPSGIGGIDIITGGGFLKGGLYIVQGTPGVGKTTLANQLGFNHVAGGGRALYVTLLAEYHARMMQNLSGMSFFDVSKIPDQLSYISGFVALRDEGIRGLLALVRREIMARNASVLILDGMVTARREAGDDQAFNEFIHGLQGFALATDCTAFLLTSADDSRKITPEQTMVDGIVELSDQLIDWSAESAVQIVKFRGSAYLRGKHAFKITDDGLVVYPRIEAMLAQPSRPEPSGSERLLSGVDQLDVMLGGGLLAGSTTMLMGPSGVGKTTFGLQFLSRCSAEEPGLLFGFYETPTRLRAKASEVCRPLLGLLDSGAVEVLWQPPTNDLLDAYGDRLLEAVRRRGVRRLFIDGLGGLQITANAPERMAHYLPALMNELRVQGVTTVYTLEVADIIGPNIRAPIGDLSSLAENLILLRYIEFRSRLYRLISILKVRDSSFDPLLHEFALTNMGAVIEASPESAEAIMVGFSRQPDVPPPPDEKPRPGRRG